MNLGENIKWEWDDLLQIIKQNENQEILTDILTDEVMITEDFMKCKLAYKRTFNDLTNPGKSLIKNENGPKNYQVYDHLISKEGKRMNNDTVSNHENNQEISNVEHSYLGNKRPADTEFEKLETGKINKMDEVDFYKVKAEPESESKLEEEAEILCKNLKAKSEEIHFQGESSQKGMIEVGKYLEEIPQANVNANNDLKHKLNSHDLNIPNYVDKENVVKIGDFVILEKDGPDNESDIDEAFDKESYLQTENNPLNFSTNPQRRNEIQKINTIIQNVESYKTNLNKNVQRKCVCCDRSDLFPSEMLKFKTVEDFLFYFKFLYEKRVSILKTDEENFEKNRQYLNELYNSLMKVQKFNLKSVRYLCKTCLVTKLNQAEGLNFIYRAMEIHIVLENYQVTNPANYQYLNIQNSLNNNLGNVSPIMPSLIPLKKKNVFETKIKLEDNTPVDHQLIENLKMGLASNAYSGNIVNNNKICLNTNEPNKHTNNNFYHSQILNKIANNKEDETGNLPNHFENWNVVNNSGGNNNNNSQKMNLNLPNQSLQINNSNGNNRPVDMPNLLNRMPSNNMPNMTNQLNNPQAMLQRLAEMQSNFTNLNPNLINSQNNSNNPMNSLLMNNMVPNLNSNNISGSNITNFSNNFNQVVDAINSFNGKNINHNTNMVNTISQLTGVLGNFMNENDGEGNLLNLNSLPNTIGQKVPNLNLNLEKEMDGESKKENSGEKDNDLKGEEKKEDVNVTNIIMNFDKAPILSYMMNVLEDLKKQIASIQYYSLLQKLFISYIFKNLEVLMEQISSNQASGNNYSMQEINPNAAFGNFLQKTTGSQNPQKGLESIMNLMSSTMNPNNQQNNSNIAINMMNMTNLPEFMKKPDDGKLNPYPINSNTSNPMEMLKNMSSNPPSNPNGINQINMLNFLNNTNKNQTTAGGNLNMGGMNNSSQNLNINPYTFNANSNQSSSMPNINSNMIIEHLLKNKGPQGVNMNNLNNIPNMSQVNNLLKGQSNANFPPQFSNNMQLNNMMGMHGMGGLGNIPSGVNNIPNYGQLNPYGAMNNQLLHSNLQQGSNMNPMGGNFPQSQGGNNQQYPMNPMFLGGMPNHLSNNGQGMNNNFKNLNNVPNQPNEMTSNQNNISHQNNSKLNIPQQQNSNLSMNLMNFLSQNQQSNDGNNHNNISESNNQNQGNEIDNNLYKFMNNQNNSNYPAYNSKSQEDLGMFNNNSSNSNNVNNMNLSNQEQLLQYLMMNAGQQNSKNEKYGEEMNPKPNIE